MIPKFWVFIITIAVQFILNCFFFHELLTSDCYGDESFGEKYHIKEIIPLLIIFGIILATILGICIYCVIKRYRNNNKNNEENDEQPGDAEEIL